MSDVDKMEENYSKSIPPISQQKKLGIRATKDLQQPIEFGKCLKLKEHPDDV